jgi:hypothetical protein
MITWTQGLIEQLKSCIERRLSAGRTAQEMHIPLGSAQGKANRLGLRFCSVVGHPYRKPTGGDRGWRPPKRENTPAVKPENEDNPSPSFIGLTIYELKNNHDQCRYIENDLYCGAATGGVSSWCPAHKKLVYSASMYQFRPVSVNITGRR